jgi:hypothetical protein
VLGVDHGFCCVVVSATRVAGCSAWCSVRASSIGVWLQCMVLRLTMDSAVLGLVRRGLLDAGIELGFEQDIVLSRTAIGLHAFTPNPNPTDCYWVARL